MTISYPKPNVAKPKRPALPHVAPTPVLRAGIALSDAHRFLGTAMGQAFMTAIWAILLVTKLEQERSIFWLMALTVVMFAAIAGACWAFMQGQRIGSSLYCSGMSLRVKGAARYVMIAGIGVGICGLTIPVAMFVTWTNGIPFPSAIGLMQIAILVWQLLLCVFLILRAIDAIKYAQAQLLDRSGGASN